VGLCQRIPPILSSVGQWLEGGCNSKHKLVLSEQQTSEGGSDSEQLLWRMHQRQSIVWWQEQKNVRVVERRKDRGSRDGEGVVGGVDEQYISRRHETCSVSLPT
jgi:hypothetical protein